MKAVFIRRFGGPEVLEYGEQPLPVPGSGEVRVRVHAAGVNPRDWLIREGRYVFQALLPRLPLILGSDVSGTIEACGAGVTRFQPGDSVFGMQPVRSRLGTYAEAVVIRASVLAHKPLQVSHPEAAALPCAGLTAFQALTRLGHIKPGCRVLVNGASGGVGSFAVQIARILGAEVTGVTSTANLERVRSLGASRVVDYTREDFTQTLTDQDVIFDAVGRSSLHQCRGVLAPGGRYLTTVPGRGALWSVLRSALPRWRPRQLPSAHLVLVRADARDLERLASWMVGGELRSLIDRTYPLADVRLAHERSRSWRTQGKLVLVPSVRSEL